MTQEKYDLYCKLKEDDKITILNDFLDSLTKIERDYINLKVQYEYRRYDSFNSGTVSMRGKEDE